MTAPPPFTDDDYRAIKLRLAFMGGEDERTALLFKEIDNLRLSEARYRGLNEATERGMGEARREREADKARIAELELSHRRLLVVACDAARFVSARELPRHVDPDAEANLVDSVKAYLKERERG